jgi:hypothetical protein
VLSGHNHALGREQHWRAEILGGIAVKRYQIANATNEAFQRWLSIVSKYEILLKPGYWNFPEPSEMPAEFLMPFEEFAKLHQLETAVPWILTISGVGYGGIRAPTVSNRATLFSCSITD